MMSRLKLRFYALVLVQAAHSVEEYAGRLWDEFPPATFATGLISQDRERGFVVINVFVIAFGLWCALLPVRRQWPSAVGLLWAWVVVEVVNGLGHMVWSVRSTAYTPGVATAPLLLLLAFSVARALGNGRIPTRS